MRFMTRTLGPAVTMAAVVAVGGAAQQADACPEGRTEVASLGLENLECNCAFHIQIQSDSTATRHDDVTGRDFVILSARRYWDFRSEPVVGRVVVGSPAAGRIRAGDAITAIDGHLITTREGSRRFSEIVPGTPVALRIRRDGREFDVTLTPTAECRLIDVPREPRPPAAPEPAAAPAVEARPVRPTERAPRPAAEPRIAVPVPRPTRAPRPPAPVRPPPTTPALGFSIECSDCSLQWLDEGEAWVWSFSEPPVIERLQAGGPAAEAGLRAGDVLTHIDGVRLTSAEGGSRFGALEAGDRVTLTYRRGATESTATLVAREAESWGAEMWTVAPARAVPYDSVAYAAWSQSVPYAEWPQAGTTRFTGSLGDAVIQVTGGRVTVTETENEIVIQSRDITVRITRGRGTGERR